MLKKFLEKSKRAISPGRSSSPRKTASSNPTVAISNVTSISPGLASTALAGNSNITSTTTQNQIPQVKVPVNSIIADPAFIAALKQHEQNLSASEMIAFQAAKVGSPQEFITTVQKLDEEHKSLSISRPLAPRVERVLMGMNQFMGAIATCIQQNPDISSLIVGGLMCVMQLAIRFFGFFEKLTEMMELLEQHLSYLSKYASDVFQQSRDVQDALVKAYGDLLEFFTRARRVFVDSDGKVSRWVSYKVFLNLAWQPFESGFYDIQVKFMNHAQIVTREAQVRGLIDGHSERQRIKLRQDLEDKEKKDKKRREVLEWLSTLDFEKIHQNYFTKHFKGTSQWFLEDENFKGWDASLEAGLLWCHGTPGTGKTILCSLVIDTITEKYALLGTTGVVFAYCNYKDSLEPEKYIATFIKQLCRTKEDLPAELETLFNNYNRNARNLNYAELQQIFLSITKSFDRVFVILDALDECPSELRKGFLNFLTGIVGTGMNDPGNIKLFVTSRKEADITRSFAGVPTIQIEARNVASDIELYVRSELDRRLADGLLVIRDPALKEEILKTLLGRADGMFLWVEFQLHDICNQISDHGIRESLKSLPETMEETYNNILLRIEKRPKPQRTLAKKILMWVAHLREPLRLDQLAQAVSIEPGIGSSADFDSHMVTDLSMLADVCLNLVVVSQLNQVRFSHYSVQEFLLTLSDTEDLQISRIIGTYKLEMQIANHEIAQACLLSLKLKLGGEHRTMDFDRKCPIYQRKSGFLAYAVCHFSSHIRVLKQLSPELWELIYEFLGSGMDFCYLMRNYTSYYISPQYCDLPIIVPALVFDMSVVSDRLAEDKELKRAECGKSYKGALLWAAQWGSCQAVEWLCAHGCDVNEKVFEDFAITPLIGAIRSYKKDMVKLLVAKGAELNSRLSFPGPVHAAVETSQNDILQLLLDHGAELDAITLSGSPLKCAVSKGGEIGRESAKLLLAKGANINPSHPEWQCILSVVNLRGLDDAKEMVNLLLESGADPNAVERSYGSVLQKYASYGYKELIQLLLDAGADINIQGGCYGTALQAAVVLGSNYPCTPGSPRDEIVKLLLENGADVNASGGEFGSALGAAINYRTKDQGEEVVRLLLAYGAKEA